MDAVLSTYGTVRDYMDAVLSTSHLTPPVERAPEAVSHVHVSGRACKGSLSKKKIVDALGSLVGPCSFNV